MANPQSNLDELMKDPKAAGLLKNKEQGRNMPLLFFLFRVRGTKHRRRHIVG